MTKVYVVYEGPDMTYYGDAEVFAVMSTKERAEAEARRVWAKSHRSEWDGEWDTVHIGEFELDETEEDQP